MCVFFVFVNMIIYVVKASRMIFFRRTRLISARYFFCIDGILMLFNVFLFVVLYDFYCVSVCVR